MRLVAFTLASLFVALPHARAAADTTPAMKLVDQAVRCAVGHQGPIVEAVISKLSALAPQVSGFRVDLAKIAATLRDEMSRDLGAQARAEILRFSKTPAAADWVPGPAEVPCYLRDLLTPHPLNVDVLNAKGKALLTRLFPVRAPLFAPLASLPLFEMGLSSAPIIDALTRVLAAAGHAVPYSGLILAALSAPRTPGHRRALELRRWVLVTAFLTDAQVKELVAFLQTPAGRTVVDHQVNGSHRFAQLLAGALRAGLSRALGIPSPAQPVSEMRDAEIEAEMKKQGFLN